MESDKKNRAEIGKYEDKLINAEKGGIYFPTICRVDAYRTIVALMITTSMPFWVHL